MVAGEGEGKEGNEGRVRGEGAAPSMAKRAERARIADIFESSTPSVGVASQTITSESRVLPGK